MSGSSPLSAASSINDSVVESRAILMPSPLGKLGIEMAGRRVTRLVIAPKGAQRRRFTSLADASQDSFLDEVLGRVSEYLAGVRRSIDLEFEVPHEGLSRFARRVLRETQKIPYGRTRSHQEVARGAGDSGAYRQVLSVLTENPLPLFIPCHRVVPLRSGVGTWIGGTRKKNWLLKLERQVRSAGG